LWEPPTDSFYYHTGTALVQELDDEYGVKVDYMAGKRRYMPDEEVEGDKYRYYVKDQLGSVVMMTDHEQNTEHYNYDAWGEHADTANLPSTENNVRYGGARVECFAKSVTSTDAIYLCGERHYWPAYGRFLQRDRMGYEKLPAPSSPLGANPYIYADNNPVMKKDLSGLQPAGYYRGARMGSESFYIGTEMPPESQMYDCCGNMRYNSLSAQEVAMSPVWNEKLGGTAPFSWWQKRAGWGSDLCKAKPGEGQPNETCKAITAATPDLMCTYLEQCKGLSCPPWKRVECPQKGGMAPIDVGYESNPAAIGLLLYDQRLWENLARASQGLQRMWMETTSMQMEALVSCMRCGPWATEGAAELAPFAEHMARIVTNTPYGTPCSDNACDAFRHCFWSCMMAKDRLIGQRCAEEIGTIHEWGHPNPVNIRGMDMANNSIGREIAASGGNCLTDCRLALSGSVPSKPKLVVDPTWKLE